MNAVTVHIFLYMGKRMTEIFSAALSAALATLGDVSQGTGRGYRTLQSYQRGERRVTASAVSDLARYLRTRAKELEAAADDLEAAQREESDE